MTTRTDVPPPAGEPELEGDRDTRFFGQPWPLASLFGVEMWERFSFYGMQGILVIYSTTPPRTAGSGSASRRRPRS